MSEYDTGFEQDIPATTHEKLRRQLGSAELDSLTRRTTPLTMMRLKAETPRLYHRLVEQYSPDDQKRSEFQVVFDELGWPDDTDAPMEPPRAYRSNVDFLHYLTDRRGSMDVGGLNNFVTHFMTDVHTIGDTVDLSEGMQQVYAAAPHLIRAHAVAPELFDTLYEVISETASFEREQYYRDNPHVVEALHKAYALTGRLVRPDDTTRHYELLGFEPTGSTITDAHTALVE